jgi:DMSO/TMAO reductase YedYZ molybdopterin-dependent catalytic subunit
VGQQRHLPSRAKAPGMVSGIKSERWATSSRNGGRLHPGTAGDIISEPWAASPGIRNLRIGGLVEHPQDISFADLRAMPKQSQITTHFCIQGWSGVAKWEAL